MTIKTTREFAPANRYTYDFGPCSYNRGWAQIDTQQDAEWFGQWASPSELKVFSYVEGDTCLHECETAEEFITLLREIERFEIEQGRKPARIDTGIGDAMRHAFDSLGASDLLYPQIAPRAN